MTRRTLAISFILGGLASLAVAGVIALLYSQSGLFNVAASRPHSQFTERLIHDTMEHSVRVRAARIEAPGAFTPGQIVAGFCQYEAHCVMCHGAAAVARQAWVNGMNPDPPYLIDAPNRWTAGQLFWIAKHGIKMTGMPAWEMVLSDQQIWDVVAFLEAVPRLPPQTYVQWRVTRNCAPVLEGGRAG